MTFQVLEFYLSELSGATVSRASGVNHASIYANTVKLKTLDLLETIDLVIFPKSRWFGVFKVRNFVAWNRLVRKICVSGLAGPKRLILEW